ncbi:MAG TPA: AtpZ/AtpI family protein [Acidimicrobiales bacterium]|jgi:F0F1-type ATP synthase assembly protein I|nr:AtpZ/AtpI family protein [Acidimicrobiales bacterium]
MAETGYSRLRKYSQGLDGDADMGLNERRELNSGFGESLTRAFELVVTPVIFGFFGWLLDGWLGTRPLFMFLLFALVMGYEFWKLYVAYGVEMKRHEDQLPGRGPETGP